MNKEWFASWFDSPFYDLLYQERDSEEANLFVNHLLEHLQPSPSSKMLDIACGKGRFSIFLAAQGYDVTGIDLSPSNIEAAKEYEKANLRFYQHDMREPFYFGNFDYALNFFTSFGYFETDEDHIKTLVNIRKSLKKGGVLVIDFLNASRVVEYMIPAEKKQISDTDFEIERREVDGFIIKNIRLRHQGKTMQFEERVRAFLLSDFASMLKEAGLHLVEVFGDYDLNPFDEEFSDRLILICKK